MRRKQIAAVVKRNWFEFKHAPSEWFNLLYWPFFDLPAWGRWIAAVLPPAHIFEGMRAVVAGEPAPWEHLAAAFALNAAYLVAAVWFVKRMLAFLRARGLVTRYA